MNVLDIDGQMLVQLAKWHAGQLDYQYKIPGCAVHDGQPVEEAVQGILEGRLATLAGRVQLGGVDIETSWKTSGKYQIKTKVNLHSYKATLDRSNPPSQMLRVSMREESQSPTPFSQMP